MRPIAIISKPQKEELATLIPELVTWMRAHDFEPILDHVSGSYTQDARIVPVMNCRRRNQRWSWCWAGMGRYWLRRVLSPGPMFLFSVSTWARWVS